MNSKISNPEVPVEKTKAINERDQLNILLEYEKNMSDNLSIALNEMSNQTLYEKIFQMFTETKQMARDLYNLMFKCGWYTLEMADTTKIQEKKQEMTGKMKELG